MRVEQAKTDGHIKILGIGQWTRSRARGRGMYEVDERPSKRQPRKHLPPWSLEVLRKRR